MITDDFFLKYGRIIHYLNFARLTQRLEREGKLDYSIRRQTLQDRINSPTNDFTLHELRELTKALREGGISGRRKRISGEELYKEMPIIRMKPFVEFAILPAEIWEKIVIGKTLSKQESEKRKQVNPVWRRIYDGTENEADIERKFGNAMKKMAADL
jgi:hypothetical protein